MNPFWAGGEWHLPRST